jgi:hypothetical protein
MEKDAFYFPHFSNARNDRKLRRVRKELGMEGYGIYFAVLEVLRDQKDFKYPLEDIDLLSDELNTSEPKVKSVICNYDLFQTNDEDFFSIKFNEFLAPYLDAKERKKIAGMKGNLVRHKHVTKEQVAEMTDQEVIDLTESIRNARTARALPLPRETTASQKKVNKSKVNKVNKNKDSKKDAVASSPFLDWKKDFSVYQEYIKDGFSKAMDDEYKKTLSNDHPTLDVLATVRKAYEYWKSEDGWDKKRSSRPKVIDFKKTIRAILRQEFNHVYKNKPKYKQQSMFDNQDYERPESRVIHARR